MKKLTFLAVALCCTVLLFAQADGTSPHGKAAKEPSVKNQPPDAKTAALLKEIDDNMLKIDGGTFTMGCSNPSDTECYYWEKPRHTVVLNTFALGKFTVTQKEWKGIMGTTPAAKYCAECPVVNVSWNDAEMFINKLNQLSNKNYRLPTEAEWEYAAKGGNQGHGYKYAGGDNAMNVAWYDSLISHEVHAVGQKKANELGLFDMSGNVWQWCSDWFDDKYYSKSPSHNPTGPPAMAGENARSLRGGSWWGPLKDCRVANRDKYPPDSKDDDVGFRLARNQ